MPKATNVDLKVSRDIDHYHKPGCCDAPEEQHRQMTEEEYDTEFPTLLSRTVEAGGDRYNVEARRYWDGIGVCITELMPGEPDDGAGMCFDISLEGLQAILPSLSEVAALVEADHAD